MSVAASLGISLMLQDQGIRDTVVMIQAVADRSVMETLAVTGQFVVSLVVLVLLGAVVFVARSRCARACRTSPGCCNVLVRRHLGRGALGSQRRRRRSKHYPVREDGRGRRE